MHVVSITACVPECEKWDTKLEGTLKTKTFSFLVRNNAHQPGWRHPKEKAITARATINDIPIPKGSWKENFDKRNSRWNKWFAIGLLTMSGTLAMVSN